MSSYAYIVADPSTYESIDYTTFSLESYDIAVTLYAGLVENEPVP